MPLDGARLPDPASLAGMAPDGPGSLAIPQGTRRIAAVEPPADCGAAEELRHFLVALSVISALVLLTGAGLLAAV